MIQNVKDAIDIIQSQTNYWFVRTDGGLYFNAFYANGFIAVGWDAITLSDLSRPAIDVKNKIARIEKIDNTKPREKAKVTDIYNKIIRLNELKKYDIIVSPSEKSEYFAFGVIEDDEIYEQTGETDDCPWRKRRKVAWKEIRPFDKLDDIFYQVRKSRHAISILNNYADSIDSVMHNVYRKDDESHFVINVKTNQQVNWLVLASTLVEMHSLMQKLNVEFQLNEDVTNSGIQIALQSPGLFNLAQKGIALILLALVLGSSGCKDVEAHMSEPDKQKIETFRNDNKPQCDTVLVGLTSLNVTL